MALRAASLCFLLLAAMPAIADDSLPSEEPAVWTRHEVDFQYMGFTTRYTCSGLKSKVRLLLKYMGVRDDVKILERGCEFGYQKVADFPRAQDHVLGAHAPREGRQGPGRAGARRLEGGDDQAQFAEGPRDGGLRAGRDRSATASCRIS